MLIGGMIAVAVAIGVMAQAWKGRTGVVWFLITGVLQFVWMLLIQGSMFIHAGHVAGAAGNQAEATALLIMVCGPALLVMGLAVASLPTRKTKATD